MRKTWPLLASALIIGTFSRGWAEVCLREVRWGFRQPSKLRMRAAAFEESKKWGQPPTNKVVTLPRISVTLINRGPAAAEGVVLRYLIRARSVSVKNRGGQGTWGVQFWVNRR